MVIILLMITVQMTVLTDGRLAGIMVIGVIGQQMMWMWHIVIPLSVPLPDIWLMDQLTDGHSCQI